MTPASGTDRLDSLDMFGATFGLADQIVAAAEVAGAVEGLPTADGITSVLIAGMGGSGIGGDVCAAVGSSSARVPIVVSKHYECPGWVGPQTLVIASSFSGNTEETLNVTAVAADAGAKLVALTSGGQMADVARSIGAPVVELDGSIPMPRAGFGAVSVSPMIVLERMGLVSGMTEQISAGVEQVRRQADALSKPGNDAEKLARAIGRSLPLIYGAGALGEAVAWRWKGQFNENPKVASWSNRVPELMHNEIAGWAVNGDVTRQVFDMVFLRHDFEHPQNARRFELIQEFCAEVVGDIHTVNAAGEGQFAQLMDLAFVGDVVSLLVAEQTGVDPGPIAILDEVKARLRG
jgi:glucose/mannose-6-phosphate isomerase